MQLRKNLTAFIGEHRQLLTGLLALQAVGFLGIYVKYMQAKYGGFWVVARLLGYSFDDQLPLLIKLSFFREDVLLNIIIIPLAVFGFLYLFKRHGFQLLFILAVSSMLSIVLFTGLYSLINVGRFISFEMLKDAIQWGYHNPAFITQYLSLSGIARIMIMLLGIAAIVVIARSQKLAGLLAYLPLFVMMIAAIFTIITFSVDIKTYALHTNVLQAGTASLFSDNPLDENLKNLNADEIEAFYLDFVGLDSTTSAQEDSLAGKPDTDILLFIIETMPADAFEFNQIPPDLKNLSNIAGRSFISSRHYTTYPYTSNAIFSILASCYPVNFQHNYLRHISRQKELGLLSILKQNGYETAVFSPMGDTQFADVPMYRLLGAKEVYLAQEQAYRPDRVEMKVQDLIKTFPASAYGSKPISKEVHDFLYYDRMAIEKMKDSVINWKRNDQQFISLWVPQLSHAPWYDLYNEEDILARGKSLALIQLRWIEEMLAGLAQEGWLENTIIVITSDHGVRTTREYPELPAGMTSRFAFNVPLLIYLPEMMQSQKAADHLTSHIDIMPTLLNYLGIPRSSYHAQGLTLWDQRERTIFFIADNYFGADAYYDQHEYFMYQSSTDQALRSTDIDFDWNQDTLLNAAEEEKIREKINTLYSIAKVWADNNEKN